MASARHDNIRRYAARVLSIAASNSDETLEAIARQLEIDKSIIAAVVRLARTTLSSSVDAGNWREARAEAEARLRRREVRP